MHGASHVGVVVRVEIGLGVDDHLGLLGAVGAVEVYEGDPVYLAAQDGEFLANRLDVNGHASLRLPLA
jgi:hypothetical protein